MNDFKYKEQIMTIEVPAQYELDARSRKGLFNAIHDQLVPYCQRHKINIKQVDLSQVITFFTIQQFKYFRSIGDKKLAFIQYLKNNL